MVFTGSLERATKPFDREIGINKDTVPHQFVHDIQRFISFVCELHNHLVLPDF